MTQRLSGLSDEEATGVAAEIFSASTRFLGRTANLQRILASHAPYLARWMLGLTASVRQPGLGASVEPRLRALATIKTSMTNGCEYCTAHTSMYGEALGLTAQELEAMTGDGWKESPAFSDRDKAVIQWSEAMTLNTARFDGPAWDDMKRLFSEAEIVEISLASAMFNMINRLNDSFRTELETEEYNRRQGRAVSGLSIEEIEDYAARFPIAGDASRREAAE
jgi:AhpD family alkylhydroperoxidase